MKLGFLLVFQSVLVLDQVVHGQLNRPWTDRDCQRMTRECDRITRGVEGSPGPKGVPGTRGPQGPVGARGRKGARGPPGSAIPGPPGQRPGGPGQPPGPQSRPGPPGDPGERGIAGLPGDKGDPGRPGPKGRKGYQGFPGSKGSKGEEGDTGSPGPRGDIGPSGSGGGWWRCTWIMNRGKDNGLLKECIFNKRDPNSVLRVAYEGNLQIGLCRECCKRWYFIFNDVECKTPSSIDAVMSGGISLDYPFYSYGRIEGFCETRFPAGLIRVGLQMENCPTFSSSAEPYNVQLYNRYGKILIQEVSPPQ